MSTTSVSPLSAASTSTSSATASKSATSASQGLGEQRTQRLVVEDLPPRCIREGGDFGRIRTPEALGHDHRGTQHAGDGSLVVARRRDGLTSLG